MFGRAGRGKGEGERDGRGRKMGFKELPSSVFQDRSSGYWRKRAHVFFILKKAMSTKLIISRDLICSLSFLPSLSIPISLWAFAIQWDF